MILKAKTNLRPSKELERSKEEMKKHNKVKVVFARIPASNYIKLGIELKRKDITLQNWIINKIEEIQ